MKTVLGFLFALLLSTALYAGGLARGQQLTVEDMYPVLVKGKWGFYRPDGQLHRPHGEVYLEAKEMR